MISLSWKLEPSKESECFSGSLCQSLRRHPQTFLYCCDVLRGPKLTGNSPRWSNTQKPCNCSLLLTCLLCSGPNPTCHSGFPVTQHTGSALRRLVSSLSLQIATLFEPVSVLWSLSTQPSGLFALFLIVITALFQRKCINCPPRAIFWWQTTEKNLLHVPERSVFLGDRKIHSQINHSWVW